MTVTTYLTPDEACQHFPGSISRRTVINRIKRGDLEGTFDGKQWFTTQDAIVRFLRAKTEQRSSYAVPDVPRMTLDELKERFKP